MSSFKISHQANVFDDHLLDIIGNEFKFDHAKGLAEWIKNSVDAYNRELNSDGSHKYSDEDQYVYIWLRQKTAISPVTFSCIDFVGMSHDDIETAFKRWGDPNAASRGKGKKMLGGHGNGGKFYMRQMFDESRFVTYRDGKLNVFGFNARKKYGFDKSYEDKPLKLKRALEIAGIDMFASSLPSIVKQRLEREECGFTVVTGESPHKIKGRNSPRHILQRLIVHPQARRLIARKQIIAVIDQQPAFKLETERLTPRADFEGPYEYDVPTILHHGNDEIDLANDQFPQGKLTLRTTAEPFTRFGDRSSLNCIDITGEIGVIGTYRMNELGPIRNFSEAEFIYGECSCLILEDPADDCVRNDREKLIENDKTKALLSWICQKVNDLADTMAEKSSEQQHVEELRQSSFFNNFLNQWMRKSRFWEKLRGEITGGAGIGTGFSGTGGGGGVAVNQTNNDSDNGGISDTENSNTGGSGPDETDDGGGEGDQKRQGPKFPDVRLSNCDPDPLGHSDMVNCEPGHPPVYQRDVDVPEGIFWINTQSPFAKKIRESNDYGPDSTRWREYMFQRHMDIIVKQAIYETEKQETSLSAARIDGLLDKITKQVYEAAANDPGLESFLFQERLDTTPAPAPSENGVTVQNADPQ